MAQVKGPWRIKNPASGNNLDKPTGNCKVTRLTGKGILYLYY